MIVNCQNGNDINYSIKDFTQKSCQAIHPRVKEPLANNISPDYTKPSLTVKFVKGKHIGESFTFSAQNIVNLGREKDAEAENIIMDNSMISAHHLSILYSVKYGWVAKDKGGATNGSFMSVSKRGNKEEGPDLLLGDTTRLVSGNTTLTVNIYIYIYHILFINYIVIIDQTGHCSLLISLYIKYI